MNSLYLYHFNCFSEIVVKMNFQQCFEILSNRDHEPDTACPCCVENRERRIPQGIEVSFPEELKKLQEILPQLPSLETLELVEKIQYIQTLRIQVTNQNFSILQIIS